MEKIKYWQPKFRILKDWTIERIKEQESFQVLEDLSVEPVIYTGQVHLNAEDKEACICPWSTDGEKEPEDYILHELLHICMIEIENKKTYKEQRAAEELFVRDLCTVIYNDEEIRST
jgi:hypothetical protein